MLYVCISSSCSNYNRFLLYTPPPACCRVSRVSRVIVTWSLLEPKIRNCPRLLFPVILRLPSFTCPTSDPFGFTDRGSHRLLLIHYHRSIPTSQTMQHTFGGKYRIEEAIANGGCGTPCLSSFHLFDVLIPLQVQYTLVPTRWPARKSLSNSSQPFPATAPSDKNQRYTRPSPVLLVYPGLCGLESTGISMS